MRFEPTGPNCKLNAAPWTTRPFWHRKLALHCQIITILLTTRWKMLIIRSGIPTHTHRRRLRPESSPLDHSASLTWKGRITYCHITMSLTTLEKNINCQKWDSYPRMWTATWSNALDHSVNLTWKVIITLLNYNNISDDTEKNVKCQKWDSNPRSQLWTASWTQLLRPLGHPDKEKWL